MSVGEHFKLRALQLTVAAHNDSLKLLTELPLVGSRAQGNWIAIDCALDVSDRIGIGARSSRIELGVTLVEDVETETEIFTVTEVGTLLDIVGTVVDVLVCQIANLLDRAIGVCELLLIACRSGCTLCGLSQGIGRVLIRGNGSITRLGSGTTGRMSLSIFVCVTIRLTLRAGERRHHSRLFSRRCLLFQHLQ
jgi:hypothetical protein